jgi:hypothetical protein
MVHTASARFRWDLHQNSRHDERRRLDVQGLLGLVVLKNHSSVEDFQKENLLHSLRLFPAGYPSRRINDQKHIIKGIVLIKPLK